MAFSPVFAHRASVNAPTSNSAVFAHLANTDVQDSFGAVYTHIALVGVSDSFSAVFAHEANIFPGARVRGSQLESPLPIERCIDLTIVEETTSPVGAVRLFASDDKNLHYVDSTGRNVNLGLLGIPLGGIMPWYPPPDAVDPPESFELCDGTLVSTIGSPFLGMQKPALMRSVDSPGQTQRFIKGADSSVGGIASIRAPTAPLTGGTTTHTHSGTTTLEGVHTHGAGTIRLAISTESSHNHGNVSGSGDGITSGAIVFGAAAIGDLMTGSAPDDTLVYHQHSIGSDGIHNHGGLTMPNSGAGETGSDGNHTHDLTLISSAHQPPYIELAYIIKVL